MVSLIHSKPEAPFGTRTVAGSGLGRPGRGAGWLTLLPIVYGEGIRSRKPEDCASFLLTFLPSLPCPLCSSILLPP